MTILDLDLDFFLNQITRPTRCGQGRLSSDDYMPWDVADVRDFLINRCKLTKPLPGTIVTDHHELFDIWMSYIDKGEITTPFDLVHVDAHADMGMGDNGIHYLYCELLHGSMAARRTPCRTSSWGLLPGNYVIFAVACRWLSSIQYIHHPHLRVDKHDIPDMLFKDNDRNCGTIQLKKYPKKYMKSILRLTDISPIGYEPDLPIELIHPETFQITEPPSFLFVAQSPEYTPATSDPLLNVIREFII